MSNIIQNMEMKINVLFPFFHPPNIYHRTCTLVNRVPCMRGTFCDLLDSIYKRYRERGNKNMTEGILKKKQQFE